MKALIIIFATMALLVAGCASVSVDQDTLGTDEYLLPPSLTKNKAETMALQEFPGRVVESGLTDENDYWFDMQGQDGADAHLVYDRETGLLLEKSADPDRRPCPSQAEVIEIAQGRSKGEPIFITPYVNCGDWDVYLRDGDDLNIVKVDTKRMMVKDVRRDRYG